jgi:LysR family glycine cleavage system transcriptional activator
MPKTHGLASAFIPRKPSLIALRAFDVASETESFTQAGELLLLSQSAVSRHIQSLEAEFGTALFHRVGRRLELTAAGHELKRLIGPGFESLDAGLRTFRRRTISNRLRVSVLPSVAAYWLTPLIGKFSALYPDIELSFDCTRSLVDFAQDDADLAIRYGRGDWSGVQARLLTRETLKPVCAPSWREQLGDKPDPEQLLELPLLFGDAPETWDDYFASLSLVDRRGARSRPTATDDNVLMQSCLNGQGFILGRELLVSNALKSGQLIAPFPHTITASYAYWIVTPNSGDLTPQARAFEALLAEEIDHG